jgi:predicted 2-oxoglutarate/Fe(II)-dependent dioxygenase YbiX
MRAATNQPLVWHDERAFSVEGLLDAAECQALVALAESKGFEAAAVRTTSGQQAMPQVRNNDRIVLDHPEWVDRLWARLRDLPWPSVDGQLAVGLPSTLRFYRYGPGQRFKMHKDGPWQERGLISQWTLLVYLNQDFEGGSTVFKTFNVTPQTGAALCFRHDTWHEGAAVVSGAKYVLRSDVLYAAPESAGARA